MRLLLIALILYVVPVWAQWGGDSRFYRTDPIPREGLVVDLDFSQFSYSGGVYTIRNMTNAAAPAYMYGGLEFNSVGSDSSGLSRDPHTGRVVLAFDKSTADSAVTAISPASILLDSTDNFTAVVLYKPGALTWTTAGTNHFLTLRLDTSYVDVSGNGAVQIGQRADSLYIYFQTPGGSSVGQTIKKPGVFTALREYHIVAMRSGTKRIVYVDNDSVWAAIIATNLMRVNRLRISGYRNTNTNNVAFGKIRSLALYRRALSSAERLTLYNNSLRGIHSKKKFSRW